MSELRAQSRYVGRVGDHDDDLPEYGDSAPAALDQTDAGLYIYEVECRHYLSDAEITACEVSLTDLVLVCFESYDVVLDSWPAWLWQVASVHTAGRVLRLAPVESAECDDCGRVVRDTNARRLAMPDDGEPVWQCDACREAARREHVEAEVADDVAAIGMVLVGADSWPTDDDGVRLSDEAMPPVRYDDDDNGSVPF